MYINNQAILDAGVAGLARLYRSGAATPRDAVAEYFRRIADYDGAIGAYIHLRARAAAEEADQSSRRWTAGRPLSPLDGVPIGVKANIAVAGAPWHAGIRAYADRVASADAACVAALRAQGAIVLGLLNRDEGALGGTTDNPWLGRTHNPYRHGFTSGGSSGGASAAVAAGLCAGALGTDTLGSVRLPAAFCGCVGYKPSKGRISVDGVVPLSKTLDHVGTLGRSVTDCALLVAGAARAAPPPDVRGMRLGVPSDLDQWDIDEELRRAMTALIGDLDARGARIVPVTFGNYDFSQMRRHALLVIEVEAMREFPIVATDSAGFSDAFAGMLRWGAGRPAAKIAEAYRALQDGATVIRAHLADVAAIIMPIAHRPAFAFDAGAPANLGDFAAPANIAGAAAIAVPLGLSADGLPLSVQVLSRDDETALSAAAWIAGVIPTPESVRK